MEQYKSPRIKKVQLDPDQAVLEVCQVGGAYVAGASQSICQALGGIALCNTALRGKQYSAQGPGAQTNAAGS